MSKLQLQPQLQLKCLLQLQSQLQPRLQPPPHPLPHHSLDGIVEAEEQAAYRSLSGASVPHEGRGCPRLHEERDASQAAVAADCRCTRQREARNTKQERQQQQRQQQKGNVNTAIKSKNKTTIEKHGTNEIMEQNTYCEKNEIVERTQA